MAVGATCGVNLGTSNGTHQSSGVSLDKSQTVAIGYQAGLHFSAIPLKHFIFQTGLAIQTISSATVFHNLKRGGTITPLGFINEGTNGDVSKKYVYQLLGLPLKFGYTSSLLSKTRHHFFVLGGICFNRLIGAVSIESFKTSQNQLYEGRQTLKLSNYSQTLFSISGDIGYEYRRKAIGLNLSIGAQYFLTPINKSNSIAPAEHLYQAALNIGFSYWLK